MMTPQILVVDDSLTIRKTVQACLFHGGYSINEAENGALALDMAKMTQYSLFIVDYNMPVMNGSELIRELRSIQHYAKTPIFMLTTELEQNVKWDGVVTGATAWIIKPFKPDSLLKGVQMALGKQK